MASRKVRVATVGSGDVRVWVYFIGDGLEEYRRALMAKQAAVREMKSRLMSALYREAVYEIWRVYSSETFGSRIYPPRASGGFGAEIGSMGSVQPQLGVLTITSKTPYAKYFMRQRQPHRPPVPPFVKWAMEKFGVSRQQAFAIAYKTVELIEDQGSTGQPVLSTALGAGSRYRKIVKDMFEEAAEKAVRAK